MIKIRWLKEELDETGITVHRGGIRTGGTDRAPIIEEGVEIEFKNMPSASQLAVLNKAFPQYKRDYKEVPFQEGEIRDLEKEVDALKAKVSALEAKSAK